MTERSNLHWFNNVKWQLLRCVYMCFFFWSILFGLSCVTVDVWPDHRLPICQMINFKSISCCENILRELNWYDRTAPRARCFHFRAEWIKNKMIAKWILLILKWNRSICVISTNNKKTTLCFGFEFKSTKLCRTPLQYLCVPGNDNNKILPVNSVAGIRLCDLYNYGYANYPN